MRRFNINVNGTAYDVQVEEVGGAAPTPVTPAPTAAPTPTTPPAPTTAPTTAPAPAGVGTKVEAPMPGNIVDVKVNVGDSVKLGDVLVVLEAMKMENDIVAPCDGKVTSITVKKGDTVNSNDTLATVG